MEIYFRAVNWIYAKIFWIFFYRSFKYFGPNVRVLFPDLLEGLKNISVGQDTVIQRHSFLATKQLPEQALAPNLDIGKGCRFGRSNHIYACESVVIGDSVLTGSGVYISDNTHCFEDPTIPIFNQKVIATGPITIGDGTWLANNVCVVGVSVGKNCVIGANSVVLTNIPNFCVAVGSPAKIVSRYDPTLKKWRSTDAFGEFS